jgi:hypothetical protein
MTVGLPRSRREQARMAGLLPVAVAAVVLLSASTARAEMLLRPDAIQVVTPVIPRATAPTALASQQPLSIRRSIEKLDVALATTAVQAQSSRRRSVGRKVLGGAVGAVGGLFAGGFIGAKIEGDSCHCDDPGLMGALIGAPIGAIVGGILGATFF